MSDVPQTKRGSSPVLAIAVAFFVITTVLLGGCTLYLLGKNVDVQDERETLLIEIEELRTRNASLQKQYTQAVTQLEERREQIEELQSKGKGNEICEYFARVRTGIITSENPKLYHSPDCEDLVGYTGEITVLTAEQLFSKDSSPCLKCHTGPELADIFNRITSK